VKGPQTSVNVMYRYDIVLSFESSSETTRWIAAFSAVSSEEEDEKVYSENDG